MTIEYASELARLLGVPVGDVLRNAGVSVGSSFGASRASGMESLQVPLVGWVDHLSNVHLDWTKRDQHFTFAAELPPTAVAIQYRTAQTTEDIKDGWLVVTLPPSQPDADAMLDRYCIVNIKDGGTQIRMVRRGYSPGRFTLLGSGIPPIHDAEVSWFSPVLMIWPK